jgi:hypothetical protein
LVTEGLCDGFYDKTNQTTGAHLGTILTMVRNVRNYSFFELGQPKVMLIFVPF